MRRSVDPINGPNITEEWRCNQTAAALQVIMFQSRMKEIENYIGDNVGQGRGVVGFRLANQGQAFFLNREVCNLLEKFTIHQAVSDHNCLLI